MTLPERFSHRLEEKQQILGWATHGGLVGGVGGSPIKSKILMVVVGGGGLISKKSMVVVGGWWV